ncbi:MAG: hypothetical protein WCX95_03210 [Candidatus Gracilibacteria bacterium]
MASEILIAEPLRDHSRGPKQKPLLRVLQPNRQEEIPWQDLTPQYCHPSHLLSPGDHTVEAVILEVRLRKPDRIAVLTIDPIDPKAGWTQEIDMQKHRLVRTSNLPEGKSTIGIINRETQQAVHVIETRYQY